MNAASSHMKCEGLPKLAIAAVNDAASCAAADAVLVDAASAQCAAAFVGLSSVFPAIESAFRWFSGGGVGRKDFGGEGRSH